MFRVALYRGKKLFLYDITRSKALIFCMVSPNSCRVEITVGETTIPFQLVKISYSHVKLVHVVWLIMVGRNRLLEFLSDAILN